MSTRTDAAIIRAHDEEWARVVATLTRRFGDLDVAEDAEVALAAVDRLDLDGYHVRTSAMGSCHPIRLRRGVASEMSARKKGVPMTDPGRLEIELQVGDDVSPLEVDHLTAAMRRELLQLDVEGVDRVSAGPSPPGAKGVDVAALGALIVSLGSAATPILGQVVEAVRAWTARGPDRTVKLTLDGDSLELGGMSESDQHQVISDWMARHPSPAAS